MLGLQHGRKEASRGRSYYRDLPVPRKEARRKSYASHHSGEHEGLGVVKKCSLGVVKKCFWILGGPIIIE